MVLGFLLPGQCHFLLKGVFESLLKLPAGYQRRLPGLLPRLLVGTNLYYQYSTLERESQYFRTSPQPLQHPNR